MDAKLEPGKYVLAVSGGVDSVVLLDLLAARPGLELVVAHFDHGIRPDSAEDAKFVKDLAKKYGLKFVIGEGRLGSGASEAAARAARYEFLRAAAASSQARGIVTAHHQDDVLETALLNLMRGTGRRGLSSLRSGPEIFRPILSVPKSSIINYAQKHQLKWREDPTNQDQKYRRNLVRHQLISRLSEDNRHKLKQQLTKISSVNDQLDTLLYELIDAHGGTELERAWLISLPHGVSREMLAAWLRRLGCAGFDRPTLERLAVEVKTKAPGKKLAAPGGYHIVIDKNQLTLSGPKVL